MTDTQTEQNLKDAFAGESQANRRYLYFAQKADVEGYNDVSAVFRSTAEGETGHAHGHGGSWGVKRANFEVALKVGRVPARRAREATRAYLASECPLAGAHLPQAMERLPEDGNPLPARAYHPIELFAKAYGLV